MFLELNVHFQIFKNLNFSEKAYIVLGLKFDKNA